MKAFDMWLEDLSHQALPGGVAAAAMAAAMGAALVIKVADTTLRHRTLSQSDRHGLEGLVDLAREKRDQLLHLAEEDELAYRKVLQTSTLALDVDERRQAWQEATEVPIRIAEACQSLLLRLDQLADACWPAVVTDLRVSRRLLAAGLDAGLEAAEVNLRAWGQGPATQPLRSRMHELRGEETL